MESQSIIDSFNKKVEQLEKTQKIIREWKKEYILEINANNPLDNLGLLLNLDNSNKKHD